MTKKNKLNKNWINQHITDHYVQMSKRDGYRSRAVYKLAEIEEDNNLFKNVSKVVDLGCAPGSWSQFAVKKIMANNSKATLVGIDLLQIKPIHGLKFIQGDFTKDEVYLKLIEMLNGELVDLVISDMAPSLTGVSGVDQARVANLVELVLDFIKDYLRVGGNALIKVFQGGEFDNLIKLSRSIFEKVSIKKPNASRSESSEMYLLCKNKY